MNLSNRKQGYEITIDNNYPIGHNTENGVTMRVFPVKQKLKVPYLE